MRKRKNRNPLMLAVAVAVMLILGAIVNLVTGNKSGKELREVETLLEVFDDTLIRRVNFVFPSRALVKKEYIQNYETYIDSTYSKLLAKSLMYENVMSYAEADLKSREKEMQERERALNIINASGTDNSERLALETERLYLMKGIFGENSQAVADSLIRADKELNARLRQMESNSPGWKYIIDARLPDETVCRFIFVAPENEPLRLLLAGGGLR